MTDLLDLLPSEYGYVILVILFSWVVVQWMAVRVSSGRKKYDVKYPLMYSDKHDIFNCIQRAHQNTLEVIGYFVVFLLLGGLKHPRICAISGLVWVVGRISYALGYYTGNPEKRLNGAYGYFGFFALLGANISLVLSLFGIV